MEFTPVEHAHGPTAPDFDWLGCEGCMVDAVMAAVDDLARGFATSGAATRRAIVEGLCKAVVRHVAQQSPLRLAAFAYIDLLAVHCLFKSEGFSAPFPSDKTGEIDAEAEIPPAGESEAASATMPHDAPVPSTPAPPERVADPPEAAGEP